ncbi:MAG: hypothetical protein ABSE47_11925 [Acidimicrobiales bacterium]
MLPTLSGRIETRLFLLALIGIPWTALISVVGPTASGSHLASVFETTYWVLAEVAIVGSVFWSPLFHFLMQFRWEKDWPIMFSLLQGIPEGVLAYVLLHTVGPMPHPPAATTATFLLEFVPLWVMGWLTAIGPMRVLVPRWRYRGGRIV